MSMFHQGGVHRESLAEMIVIAHVPGAVTTDKICLSASHEGQLVVDSLVGSPIARKSGRLGLGYWIIQRVP